MTLKTYTVEKKNPKHNQEWSWEETPELVEAVATLHKSSEALKNIKVPTLHVGSNTFAAPPKRVVK